MNEKDLEFLKKLATLKENGIIDSDELQKRKREYFEAKEEAIRQKEEEIRQRRERERQADDEMEARKERWGREAEEKKEKRRQFILKYKNKTITGMIIAVILLVFLIDASVMSARTTLTGMIIAVILLVFLIYKSVMSTRMTFDSEEEMRESLQGTWTCYDSGYDSDKEIIIDDDWGEITSDEYHYSFNVTWNPSKGTFESHRDKFIAKKNGTIKVSGDVYMR